MRIKNKLSVISFLFLVLIFCPYLHAKLIEHQKPKGLVGTIGDGFPYFNLIITTEEIGHGQASLNLMMLFRFDGEKDVHVFPLTHEIPPGELKPHRKAFVEELAWLSERVRKKDEPLSFKGKMRDLEVEIRPSASLFEKYSYQYEEERKAVAFPCSIKRDNKYHITARCTLRRIGQRGVMVFLAKSHEVNVVTPDKSDLMAYQGNHKGIIFQGEKIRVTQRGPGLFIGKPVLDGNLKKIKVINRYTNLVTNTIDTENDHYTLDGNEKFPTVNNYDSQLIKVSCSNHPVVANYQSRHHLYKEDCNTNRFSFIDKNDPTKQMTLYLMDTHHVVQELDTLRSGYSSAWQHSVYENSGDRALVAKYHTNMKTDQDVMSGKTVEWQYLVDNDHSESVKRGWGLCGDLYPCLYVDEPLSMPISDDLGRTIDYIEYEAQGGWPTRAPKNIARKNITEYWDNISASQLEPIWRTYNHYFIELKRKQAKLKAAFKNGSEREVKRIFDDFIEMAEKARILWYSKKHKKTFNTVKKQADKICQDFLLPALKKHDPLYRDKSDYFIGADFTSGGVQGSPLENKLMCNAIPNVEQHTVCQLPYHNEVFSDGCKESYQWSIQTNSQDFQGDYLWEAGTYMDMMNALSFSNDCFKTNTVKTCLIEHDRWVLSVNIRSLANDKAREKKWKTLLK